MQIFLQVFGQSNKSGAFGASQFRPKNFFGASNNSGSPWGGGGVGTRPWWLALLACGGAYWPLALEPSAMTSRHPYFCGHPHRRGHPPALGGGGESRVQLISARYAVITKTPGWEGGGVPPPPQPPPPFGPTPPPCSAKLWTCLLHCCFSHMSKSFAVESCGTNVNALLTSPGCVQGHPRLGWQGGANPCQVADLAAVDDQLTPGGQ